MISDRKISSAGKHATRAGTDRVPASRPNGDGSYSSGYHELAGIAEYAEQFFYTRSEVDAMMSPYTTAVTVTPGTPVTAGRGVGIACSADGNLALKLSSGSVWIVPVYVGLSVLDNLSITDVVAASTTATVTVTVLS